MFQGCKTLCFGTFRPQTQLHKKLSSLSKSEIVQRRNVLFNEEKKKQRAAIGRIEKIEVKYLSPQAEATLVMNKNISTPYDCTRHISSSVSAVAALAVVDGKPWDMNEPLVNDCELKILTMSTPELREVNNAFWRTCSFILGYVANAAFKDNVELHLHSFLYPIIKSGSFTYDVHINLPEWIPTQAELLAMSALFKNVSEKQWLCERLKVHPNVALDIFQDNPFKFKQIPSIAEKNDNMVTLYRIDDHIDISKGPMVGNTGIVGRCSVTAVHKLKSEDESENLYRIQGVAIPRGIAINHFAYGILEKRSKKWNLTNLNSKWKSKAAELEEGEKLEAVASQ